MVRELVTFSVVALLIFWSAESTLSAEFSHGDRILATAQKIISVIESVEDFICEAEVIYYRDGEEDKRYRITFYYKQMGKIRVKFSWPYPGVTVFYKAGNDKLTVKPFKFLPVVKFRFSINNPMVRTPSGQRIYQTDVQYFINFLFRNVKSIQEKENSFYEGEKQIKFMFHALYYIEDKRPEKYRVFVSKKNWFPTRIERYNLEGTPIEIMIFKNHIINPHLDDTFFRP